MKKLLFICLMSFSLAFFSCNEKFSSQEDVATQDSIAAQQENDSIAALIHKLDSINNSGSLIHMDIYKIGKLRGIEFSVQKVQIDSTSIAFINLRKDCGGEYYYSWEDAMIFSKELSAFYTATSTIKDNVSRTVDHEERYAYVTKDRISIASICESSNNWKIRFSIDTYKSNSTINLSVSEIDNLVDLLKKAETKLEEIE